jgi:hypothetical protein
MILHKAVNEKINSFSKDIENSGTSINGEFGQNKQENTSKVTNRVFKIENKFELEKRFISLKMI